MNLSEAHGVCESKLDVQVRTDNPTQSLQCPAVLRKGKTPLPSKAVALHRVPHRLRCGIGNSGCLESTCSLSRSCGVLPSNWRSDIFKRSDSEIDNSYLHPYNIQHTTYNIQHTTHNLPSLPSLLSLVSTSLMWEPSTQHKHLAE
jgi:hypothetical protein